MNENINLCKILKGLEGIKLYSSVCGKCTLSRIFNDNKDFPIILEIIDDEGYISEIGYTERGFYAIYDGAECTLFPSKEQRDWSKFKRPIPVDTPMMCANNKNNNNGYNWRLCYYAGISGTDKCIKYSNNSEAFPISWMTYVIPFNKFNPNDIEESLKYNIQK